MLSQHKCGGYDAGEVTATYSQEKGWSWKTGDDSCRTSVHNLFIAKAEKHATVSKNVLLSKEKRVKKKKKKMQTQKIIKDSVSMSGGGGGVFLTCADLGRMIDHSFPTCTLFYFLGVEISLRALIPLFHARISPPWLSELK